METLPLIAIRVMGMLADRIIGHHVKHEIFGTIVDKLRAGSPGLNRKSVAQANRLLSISMADRPTPGDHVVKLPLRAVRMKGIRSLPRWYPQDLDIKGMALHQIR